MDWLNLKASFAEAYKGSETVERQLWRPYMGPITVAHRVNFGFPESYSESRICKTSDNRQLGRNLQWHNHSLSDRLVYMFVSVRNNNPVKAIVARSLLSACLTETYMGQPTACQMLPTVERFRVDI